MTISDKLVWISCVFLFSSITIFESYTWGKYVLMIACALIFGIDALAQKGKYNYCISGFHKFMMALIVFTFLSSIWGISASDSMTKTFTFIQILVCMTIVYNHYFVIDDVSQLISIVKWSGYVISLYSICYYGLDFIMSMMTSGVRIDNAYTNINTIGMISAIAIIIQVDEIIRTHRVKVSMIFVVPAFIMVIATQSRKALLILIIGIMLSLIMRNLTNGKMIWNIIKIIIILVVSMLLLKYLSSFEIFAGINERMNYLVAMFTGEGEVGNSALMRQALISLGVRVFMAHPLLGIGIGCPHIIAGQQLNFDAYLHNGFVEVLAGGGIIGFILYYGVYAYLLWNMYKYRKYADENSILVCILVFIFLFRDYAMVSIYDKGTYFYFLIFFIALENMKKRALTSD